ncbi:vesicular-fusion protein S17 [Ceratobasidium sp. 428]|nr:vesicular-fusion protein S17 [Ceratobasidium sp. 428]
MTPSVSQSQLLLSKADKKASSFAGWIFSNSSKFQEAGDLYQKAANSFQIDRLWKEAGDAFMKEGNCREQTGEKDEATNAYWNAAKAYKQDFPDLASNALIAATSNLDKASHFRQAVDREKEIGQIYLQDTQDLPKASKSFEAAGGWYAQADATAAANARFKDMADLHAELGNHSHAVALYEQMADHSLTSTLTKHGVKECRLRAGLCALAMRDTATARRNLNKYGQQDVTFSSTREAKFVGTLIEAVEAYDIEVFTQTVVEYNQVNKLDNWKTTILLSIKRTIGDTVCWM